MPRFTGYPWIRRLLGKGINKDIAPELLPDGLARDAFFVRPTSSVGATGAIEAVGGEELLYDIQVPGQQTYRCIGNITSRGKVVHFWASDDAANFDPFITVDGVVTAQSQNIPYVFDRPLKMVSEDRCGGGIVYPVDGVSIALYWDVEDMLEQLALGNQVYFAEYTTEFNSVALSVPAEFPVFDGLVSGQDGLPVGQYLYSLRYTSPAGDRTNRGPETPLVSVPIFQDFDYSTIYPGGRTVGGTPSLLVNTQYAIRIRFRIDNTQGYESVEVCRMRFNDGQGLGNPGIYEVVARIPLVPNQFGIITYTDPGEWTLDPPEVIPPDEAADQLVFPLSPNAVEIADNRLLYANTQSTPQQIPLTFDTNDQGNTVVPITQRITTVIDNAEYNSGHADPYNLAYYRSFGRGERYAFAAVPWDGNSAKLPGVPIPGAGDYQFPNRRDIKGPLGPYGLDSLNYSTDTIDGANTQCQSAEPVSPTYDVLTQGSRARVGDFYDNPFKVTGDEDEFNPIRPINYTDPNQSVDGWELAPAASRFGLADGSLSAPDTGAVFNQRHHALGLLVKGIGNIPPNIKALTIARSEPAGRVVASGFGFWDFDPAIELVPLTVGTVRKTNSLRCHFPEIEAAIIPQAIVEDIENNPQNYRIQLVGGYGFYQDPYGYFAGLPAGQLQNVGQNVDALLYASVTNDPAGQVNVLAPSDAWEPGPNTTSPPGEYIGTGKWRNPTFFGQEASLPFMTDPEQGNFQYGIAEFTRIAEGRSYVWKLQTNEQIYTPGSDVMIPQTASLNDDAVRRVQQPVYAINIIRIGANVDSGAVPLYSNTATTVKMSSVIGIMPDGSPSSASFELLGERLEDVRPYVLGTTEADLRYIYVKEPGQAERAWVNITNMAASVIDIPVILADIAANGFWLSPDGTQVYGLYQVQSNVAGFTPGQEFSSGASFSVTISASSTPSGQLPVAGSRIIVKFCGKNIRVFGGDRFISRQVFSPYDKVIGDTQFVSPPPLPQWGFSKSDGYEQPSFTFDDVYRVRTYRQIAVMWDGEVRLNSPMDVFIPQVGMSQPRTMYILRPYLNIDISSGTANGLNPQFDDVYQERLGFNVALEFAYGGISYQHFPGPNLDYSKQPNLTFAGLPEVGFDEPIDQCTAIYASNEYLVGSQDTPGFRTFLSSNIKFLSTENGPINELGFALSGDAGTNVYAWTERGVCRILYNKNILSGASGEQISTQQISNLWGDEMWITRNIGLPDQMWRWFVKAYAPTGQGYADSFFWMDRKGAYRMTGDNIIDISRDRYLSELAPTLLNFPSDYGGTVCSLYNVKDDEVWFYIASQTLPPDPPVIPSPVVLPDRLFVYNARLGEWIGQFDFRYGKLVMRNREILGGRTGQVFALDEGFTVNGVTRVASITVPFFGEVGKFKQHLRWRITGLGDKATYKPDEIRILDSAGNVLTQQNFAIAFAANPTAAPWWVLYYDSWEQHTACILQSIDPLRRPPQDTGFFVQLIWNTEGYKNCLAVSSQLQPIR